MEKIGTTADTESSTGTIGGEFGFATGVFYRENVKRKNPWRVVGVIAERLGVPPIDGREASGAMIVCGAEYVSQWGPRAEDGPSYDINEVAVALLDKLDQITKD